MPIHTCVSGSQLRGAYEATKGPDWLHKTSDSRNKVSQNLSELMLMISKFYLLTITCPLAYLFQLRVLGYHLQTHRGLHQVLYQHL